MIIITHDPVDYYYYNSIANLEIEDDLEHIRCDSLIAIEEELVLHFALSPDKLRKLADFFNESADVMEKNHDPSDDA